MALFLDLKFHPDDILPPRLLAATAIGTMAWPFAWLLREERRASHEKKARIEAMFAPAEVIPVERFKPPGYDRRKPRHGVVTVSKRRVRRVATPSPFLSRRKALGLGHDWPQRANRKRENRWYRRIIW